MSTQINQVMLEHIDQTSEPPKQFTFDAVYPVDSITETIYADSVFPLVESVCQTMRKNLNKNIKNSSFIVGSRRIQCNSICLRTNRVSSIEIFLLTRKSVIDHF